MRTESDSRIVMLLRDAFIFVRIPYRILNALTPCRERDAARRPRSTRTSEMPARSRR
ncbi:hypothetical protein C7S16_5714 [Burkholderia thailandensis]|uniref:Uncharacterized protein n=1 Tax=Burkholderia thailandensis TaxID=57975 RepID=A0AAW9CRN1_BURTH|nr:hypothetical protein [Burkholderia thailandensis]MDW9251462.1 hypothetical protein [Burkholderia thailandensis]